MRLEGAEDMALRIGLGMRLRREWLMVLWVGREWNSDEAMDGLGMWLAMGLGI